MKQLILYVEDNDLNVLVVKRLLESSNFELIAVDSAEEGLLIAESRRPSLILMDLNLPGMDGLTATRKLKAVPTLRPIPVIAVTGDRNREEECWQVGCEDCLVKPLTRAKLLIALQRYGSY
jgi:CheY-like chemotaxis protein